MTKLTSPYNFVPLNRRVYVPSWYNEVSQDIPFEDGEDGWIEVTWKNVSPLIIKEGSDKGDSGNKKSVPFHVEEADGKRRYFIPGTSMKGMLRSTLEILSFGKMEQYQREIKVKKKSVSVQNLVEKEQKPVEGKDLCEIIFGFTGKDMSLRGRVQLSHAFCTDAPYGKELLDEKYGVLGEPKPSFYPLYLKQPGPQYKTFNNADGIAGRKLYRVHTGESVRRLPEGNGNDNTTSYFRPLRTGLTFVMRINLHNMRPVETGAILSALTLHDTKGAWHNIGSGKAFGYGKIECVDVKLERLKHDKAYYMRAFEEEMECFTRKELSQKWRETEQTTMLVNILSEHSDDDVRMMTLKEYGDVSKKDPFQRLVEGKRGLTSLFDKKYWKRKFREGHNDEYDKVEKLIKEGKLADAISIYNGLISKLLSKELSTDEEEKKVEEIKAEIRKRFLEELKDGCEKAKELEEEGRSTDAISIYNGLILKLLSKELSSDEEEKIKGDLHDRITRLRLAMGLKALLEEKYPDGRYKRDTVKKALDVTDNRWLKKVNRKELTEQEKEDLLSTLERLKSDQNKADKRMWGNPRDNTWVRIERMIGDELTNKLRL